MISDIVDPRVPATYNHYGVLHEQYLVMHEQYLVNGEFHLGPRILSWSRGKETKQRAVYFPTRPGLSTFI